MRHPSLKRIARRVARPLTSPVDGRVADINRRVADAQRSVTAVDSRVGDLALELGIYAQELGTYAIATTESDAYVGVEMRRLEETIDLLRAHIDEHEARIAASVDALEIKSYVERLARAAEAPLEQLDGAVANLINHSSGHRGFAAQAGLWFNPPVTIELSEGSGRLAAVNERIVETPFAFGALARLSPPARILEIGSAESTFSLAAASLGYLVTALDLHPLPYTHPNLESFAGPLEQWNPGQQRFDAAFLISTIEHFGLGAYGEPIGPDGADRTALSQVAELLSDDGFLVLTTPYGRARVDSLERIYDDEALAVLLEDWDVIDRRIAQRHGTGTWITGDPDTSNEEGHPGVVMVVATPSRTT
jgi:hypothetical protein